MSKYIYIRDTEYGFIPAEIIEKHSVGEKVTSVTASTRAPKTWEESTHCFEGTEYSFEDNSSVTVKVPKSGVDSLPFQNISDSGDVIAEADMANLGYLHEAAVLFNLKERHYKSLPYTRVNDIMVSSNPFFRIDNLYGIENLTKYANTLIWDGNNETVDVMQVDPHLYEISCGAYKEVVTTGLDQSILVSGESGSGKTYSAKILMENLANFRDLASSQGSSLSGSEITSKILQSSTILEAFGNAQTLRNENSSRFSKFVQLEFNIRKDNFVNGIISPELLGASTTVYVLEKSRVTQRNKDERNYHIFHQLLAAENDFKVSQWNHLKDTDLTSFKYCGKCKKPVVNEKPDSEHFKDTLESLSTLGLSDEEQKTLFRAVCAILQLGNIIFGEDSGNSDQAAVTSQEELIKLSEIAGISLEEINEALTSKTVTTRNESFKVPLKLNQAEANRDTLAQDLFSNVFNYMVDNINNSTESKSETKNSDMPREESGIGHVNLLDIYGFESYKENGFDQLCINYANEKIQFKYVLDNFEAILKDYATEGIVLQNLPEVEEPEVLRFIEGKGGLITLLGDQCISRTPSARAFVQMMKKTHKAAECLVAKKIDYPDQFGIVHFADTCNYRAAHFITMNRDSISNDLIECASSSNNQIISTPYKKLILETKAEEDASEAARGGRRKSRKAPTVLGKFRTQLKSLMRIIEDSKARYVRCIKPNSDHIPHKTNQMQTLNQLRSAGLVAALSVSRNYFQQKLLLSNAIPRFQCLLVKEGHPIPKTGDFKKDAENMFGTLLSGFVVKNTSCDDRSFAIGNTKIYFREGSLQDLESRRYDVRTEAVLTLQIFFRKMLHRLRFLAFKKSVVDIQAYTRMREKLRIFLKLKAGCIMVQTLYRTKHAKAEMNSIKRNINASRIQNWYRCRRSNWSFVKMLEAAKKINRFLRRRLSTDRFTAMMSIVVEEASKKRQMEQLVNKISSSLKAKLYDDGECGDCKENLEESLELLKYSLDIQNDYRGKLHGLKFEKDNSNQAYKCLEKNYYSAKEKNKAVKLQVKHLNKTNNALMENLNKQRKSLSTKSKELRNSNSELIDMSSKYEADKIMAEESHNEEIMKLKKIMEEMKEQHELNLKMEKEKQAVRERKLHSEIKRLEQELIDEEEAYSMSFHTMMDAFNKEAQDGEEAIEEELDIEP